MLNLGTGLKEARTEGWVEEGRSCRAGTERLSVWTAALLLLLLLLPSEYAALLYSTALSPCCLPPSISLSSSFSTSVSLAVSWHVHSGSGDKRRQTIISLLV